MVNNINLSSTMTNEKRPPTSLSIAMVCMAHGREERGARHVLVRETSARNGMIGGKVNEGGIYGI
jgi:hypothetical protein